MGYEQQVADTYRHTFAARLDDHAVWAPPNEVVAEDHWARTRRELTVDAVLTAFRERKPLSAYMEDREGATHVGVVDFDRDDGWGAAVALAGKIKAAGGFAATEHSRRGAHLWVVLDEVVPGSIVRLGLRAFVAQVNPALARDPKVEINPKVIHSRGPDTVGNCVRMPMMVHQRTGKASKLYRFDGSVLGDRIGDTLINFEMSDANLFADMAEKAPMPPSEMKVPESQRRPAEPGGDIVSILVANGRPEARPGRAVKCIFHPDNHPSLSVAKDGERVFCKNPECEAYNGGRGLGERQVRQLLERVRVS